MCRCNFLGNFPIVVSAALLLLPSFSGPWDNVAYAKEFVEESESNFVIRSKGQLEINNLKGSIQVEGWAQEKIKIVAQKRVVADSIDQAKTISKSINYRFFVDDQGNVQISNQYGDTSSLEDRLKASKSVSVQLNLRILAPPQFEIQMWTTDGGMVLRDWQASASLRSNGGSVQVEDFKGKMLTFRCRTCTAKFKDVNANLHLTSNDGTLSLERVEGGELFVDTNAGAIHMSGVRGVQVYSSKTGPIMGEKLDGKIEVHTYKSKVELMEVSGSLSGSIGSGSLTGDFKKWLPEDENVIDSFDGSIRLSFPQTFSSDLDLWSLKGKTLLEFSFDPEKKGAVEPPAVQTTTQTTFQISGVKSAQTPSQAAQPNNHLMGKIGGGGPYFKIFSETGNIEVVKTQL